MYGKRNEKNEKFDTEKGKLQKFKNRKKMLKKSKKAENEKKCRK